MKNFVILSLLSYASLAQGAAGPIASAKFEGNPFKGVCENTGLLKNSSYAANKDYWDEVRQQCGADVQILPETGFFAMMASRLGEESDQEKSARFLEQLGQRTLDTIDYNNKMTEVWIHCANRADNGKRADEEQWFSGKQATARELMKTDSNMGAFDIGLYDSGRCEGRLGELKTLLDKKGHDLRVAHELMKRSAGLHNVAASLLRKTFGVELAAEKVPLTADELADADKAMKQAVDPARASLVKEGAEGAQRLARFRAEHPNAPLESIGAPYPAHWVFDFFKAGGGRGGQLSDGAQTALDIALDDQVRKEVFPKAFSDYTQALGQARILAFLDKKDPSSADIAQAASKLLQNGTKSRDDTAKLMADHQVRGLNFMKRDMTHQERIDELKPLLQNGPILRELLSESPGSCGVAAGVVNYAANQNTKNGAIITVGLLAGGIGAGVVAPALLAAGGLTVSAAAVSTTIGAATGGATLYNDYSNYRSAKARSFSLVHSDDNTFGKGTALNDLDEYSDARNAFVVNAALTLATTAATMPSMYKQFFAENQGKLQSEAVLKTLMSKGGLNQTEAEAKQTLRDLASADKAVAQRAISTVAKAMNVDENEIALFQKVVQKQMLDPNAQSEFTAFSKRLAALKGPKGSEERKVLLGRMNEILDNIQAEKMNGAKRSDAMRLVLAASEFGPYDSAQVNLRAVGALKNVAEKINGWDEGLYGLARTYEQARANLLLPEIAALAPEQRMEAAYGKALDQLGVSDPGVRASMMACGLHPAK